MWAPGWCAGLVEGWGWIFPLVGLVVCLAFLVMAVRVMTTGRGFMCMGGHRDTGSDERAEMRREIHALHERIEQLKASR